MSSSSILYLILAVACILSSSYYSKVVAFGADQPVFVLETSDSSESSQQSAPFQANNEPSSSSSNSNTQIITDDNGPAQNVAVESKPTSNQVVVIQRHHSSSTTSSPDVYSSSAASNSGQYNKQQANNNNNNNKEAAAATVRRLDDSPPPSQRSTNTRSAQQARPKPTTTTTTTTAYPNYESQSSNSNVPKADERLLISITSEEDEYKPPQRQVIASTGGFDEVQPVTSLSQQQQQQQQPQYHKKKPAITISIQDNSNKLGGSGTPSVILRPSENGQSIIISTLGSSAIETNSNNNNNKYNPNKPAISIVSSNGHINNNNNNGPPYREPVADIPVHNPTHRPSSINNNDYNQPANKPIVSTLIDQPRPPVNVMTQRPPIVALNEDYEPASTARPSTSRPPTPNQPTDYNNENTNGADTTTNNNNNQGAGSSKFPLNEKNCGVIHETRIVGGDEANPNDFLWMAAIVKSRPTEGEVKPFCGGSLITRRHILTAAHCLANLAPRDVLVRLGSYDFDDSTASPVSNDYAIDQFRKPAQYNKQTHVADIAIMRLKTPLQLSDNYRTVCMPQSRRSYVGALGTVTGYGSQSQTFRRAAPKLRQVTVPIWENRKCSAVYKKNLTESFLCAGYDEGGKDACQGDSGGPLMTEGPNERTIVVGVVSHGIGCGSPGYPGVYTRISTFLDWIEENTRE